ncbi:MAG TPA: bifunctional YncE family protein/alkaline phosphatase family protein [Candidatus Eremiobacteraceae bacterium]|nr:bifunctional YncE family protein/alkaline phosphatase family protein [Candidatus Eremiobacteraceae bacterium]
MISSRLRGLAALVLLVALALLVRANDGTHAATSIRLPNGWRVTPAGATTPLGTLPLHMVEDPNGKWLAVTNGGYGELSISLVDEQSGQVVSTLPMKTAFYGLAFAPKKLYASTAYGVESFTINGDGALTDAGPVGTQSADFGITGIAATNSRLYIADGASESISAHDASGAALWTTKLGGWPYAVAVSRDEGKLYVSDWTTASVSVLDAKSGALTKSIPVGSHPNAELLSPDGTQLFVACANDDSVKIIDTASGAVRGTIDTGIFAQAPPGAIPNGLALSSNGTILYVADAGENAVVAVDLTVAQPAVFGAIPTGWFPTDVIATRNGQKLFVLDGKGVAGHANPKFIHADRTARAGPDDYKFYVANTAGDIEMLNAPDRAVLAAGLSAVRWNSAYNPKDNLAHLGSEGLHVIYVIKENRTYDEVLGDDPRGNGDSSLTIFGRRITPNIHKLVNDFALLDNFDTDAAVSADGHNWSTAAYASDYVDKLWPATYSDRRQAAGHTVYDYEQAGPAVPPGGYLWENARKHGVSVRDYGEFVTTARDGRSLPSVPSLAGLIDPQYRGFDLKYSDQERISEWLREFNNFVAHHNLPQLEIVRLPNDHTSGTRPGAKSPYAMMADNDYALGRLVDAVSHSPYWRDTIIFSLEDDAQAGPDHVSDHRAEVLVIGAQVKRGFVDHTHYTTSSVIHTIEEILGLPPMSQYDAGATTMFRLQTDEPNVRPWTAIKPLVNLNDVNPPNPDAKSSQALNFDEADAADPATLNAILWRYAMAHKAR